MCYCFAMEINVIGRKEDWGSRPQLTQEDRVHFHDLPNLSKNPINLFKFFRKIKKCMVLYWIVDEATEKKLNVLPSSVLFPAIRTIIKKPGGPAIVIEDAFGTRLGRLGDIVLSKNDDYLKNIKDAYFLGECGHPSIIYKEKKQKQRIDWLKKNVSGRVLEIGCSTGFVLNYVGGGVGVDIDQLRLEYAKKTYPRCQFLYADAAKMNFADQEFDTVMIPDILEHVEMEHAARIVKEALRVGKKLIITVPNAGKANYDKALVENPEHRWFPTRNLMTDMIGKEAEITFSPDTDFIYVVTNFS